MHDQYAAVGQKYDVLIRDAGSAGRPSEVPDWLNRAEEAIGRIEEGFGELQSRLGNVSRQPPPQPTGTEPHAVEAGLVPYANRLRNLTRRAENIASQISSAHNALEL